MWHWRYACCLGPEQLVPHFGSMHLTVVQGYRHSGTVLSSKRLPTETALTVGNWQEHAENGLHTCGRLGTRCVSCAVMRVATWHTWLCAAVRAVLKHAQLWQSATGSGGLQSDCPTLHGTSAPPIPSVFEAVAYMAHQHRIMRLHVSLPKSWSVHARVSALWHLHIPP